MQNEGRRGPPVEGPRGCDAPDRVRNALAVRPAFYEEGKGADGTGRAQRMRVDCQTEGSQYQRALPA